MRRLSRHPRRNPQDALIAAIDEAIEAVENDEIDPDYGIHDELRLALSRAFGGAVGPSADWVNYTWRLGGNLFLFEEDEDGAYIVLRRTPADDPDDPDEDDQIEDVESLPDLHALREYLSRRANPSRRPPPPPPPSHTFALTAEPVQQGLFGAGAFEAKPKKRAPEPVIDERQVDLFAPPPPKKNPAASGVAWKKYGPKGPDWEGEWLVSVDGQQFRAWRDPEIGSYWFVPASDTRTSLHGAALDQKSPAVHAGFDREECVRAIRKFLARR